MVSFLCVLLGTFPSTYPQILVPGPSCSGMDVAKVMPHWPDPGGDAVFITSALKPTTKPKVNGLKGPMWIRGLSALPIGSCEQLCGSFWLNSLFPRKKEEYVLL